MSEDVARNGLVEQFGRPLADHADSMTECLSLLRLYSLTPQTLFYRWEAFALSSLPSEARANPTLQDFRALRQHLQSSLETANASSSSAGAYAQTPKKDGLAGFGAGSAGRTGGASARKMMGLGGLMGSAPSSTSMQTPSRPSALSRGSRPTAGGVGDDSMEMDDSPLRPGAARANGGQQSSGPAGAWHATQTLNSKIPASNGDESRGSSSRVALAVGTDPRKWQYRYMFERGGERGEALDDSLESYSSLILETYNISEEDLGDPSHTHQQSVYVVGRITPNLTAMTAKASDNTAATAGGLPRLKPSADGILIESSKLQGAGARVPIRFEKDCTIRRPPGDMDADSGPSSPAELLGLFPGQVLCLKGRNGGGSVFGVEEVLLLPSLYQASTAPSRLLELQHTAPNHLRGQALNIAVASGPYTAEMDLDFAPWHALMDNVAREAVDVLVLLGPFIPLSHPLLPTSQHLPADLFKQHFASRLNSLTSPSGSAGTTPILLPSVLDALTSHAAWPQPKYDAAELGLSKKTKLLPNPCLFSVNEVVVGVSTADVLRDLRGEELVVRLKNAAAQTGGATPPTPQKEDVIARAVRHIMSQRSFYPLFPPPQPRPAPGASSEEAPLPLSLPHQHLALWQSVTPDVLLLPSCSLAPFAKIVDGTIVINPGPAAGGGDEGQSQEEGKAAKLTILPLSRAELEQQVNAEDEPRGHDVWSRTRVDLLGVPLRR